MIAIAIAMRPMSKISTVFMDFLHKVLMIMNGYENGGVGSLLLMAGPDGLPVVRTQWSKLCLIIALPNRV